MGWLIDVLPLAYTDAVVAIGAGLLGLIAGVLGSFAVLQQRSLVGDALSHATLPGVCIAFIITGTKDPLALLVGAGIAGLVGALLMVGIERTSRIRPDAAIGVVLSGFFALGIVLLTYIAGSNNANQAGLDKYLFGQAAGLSESDINVMLVLGGGSLLLVVIAYRALKTTLFDRAYAGSIGIPVRLAELLMTALLVVAIIVGVRVVGAILMVAMIIMPSVIARQLVNQLSTLLPVAGIIGAVIGSGGALLSVAWAVPTGPVVILFGFVLVSITLLMAPGRGVLWRGMSLRRTRARAHIDGVLLDLETMLHAGAPPTQRELASSTGRSRHQVRRAIRELRDCGMVDMRGDRMMLGDVGAAAAHALVERRSLWSAWLEHGWRLDLPDAREPDPRDVRASLGDERTEQLLQLAGAAGGGQA